MRTVTVVITRPAQQAQPWVCALQQRGYSVKHIPLLNIAATDNTIEIQATWHALGRAQWGWVMFVSRNAVHYFFTHAGKHLWPDGLRAGSPGEGTTQALADWGVPLPLIDQPQKNEPRDSEHLWQNIAQRDWKAIRVLLVRGSSQIRPQRDWLVHQLQNAGAQVDTLEVYQRLAPGFSPEVQTWLHSAQARTACWVLSSVEALEYLPANDWTQTTAIVTHSRIARAARQVGFGRVICTQPDLHSLVDSVESVA